MSDRTAQRIAKNIETEFGLRVAEHSDSALEDLIEMLSDYLDTEHDDVEPTDEDHDDDHYSSDDDDSDDTDLFDEIEDEDN